MTEKKETPPPARKRPTAKRKAATKKATSKKTTKAKKSAASKSPPRKTASVKANKARTSKPQAGGPNQKAENPFADMVAGLNDESMWSDPSKLSAYMRHIGTHNREILTDVVERQVQKSTAPQNVPTDPLNVGDTMQDVFSSIFANPANLMRTQFGMWEDYIKLLDSTGRKALGQPAEPVAEPDVTDRRFNHKAWTENQSLDFIKQSYLIMSRWARSMVDQADDVDEHTKKKASFYTEQFLAALSPTNFATTNPEVMEETVKSKGENFLRGYKNLLEDMERGQGELDMKQTDLDFFEVGKNIATTPGKVVFQNDILQLIQYTPTTELVDKAPLLIFPPWINKYYILDLQPENSLVSWLLDQGKTVFVVSWVNPDKSLAHKTFIDYMHEGIFGALDAVEAATGENQIDTIGYCIGGTLLSVALGYMAKKGDTRIKSATFFTAQMDFQEAGELLLFVDDKQIENIEKQIDAADGIFEASVMSRTFNMLRPVDLIWSVYVDNYLLGKEPKRFDLLFWNSDATNMSKSVYLYYLREFYQHNRLSLKELVIDDVTIDLGKVTVPIFMQSGERDHIAPFRSIYRSAKLYGGPVTFMLAGSGHIAGVINHPNKQKYHYSTNANLPETIEQWIGGAERHEHSWWPYWMEWLSAHSTDEQVPARIPGEGKLPIIEDAPGSYVKAKAGQ